MINCPKCLGKLEEKNVENVKVDICWVCEGVWFDRGELEKVLVADSTDFNKIDVDRDILDGQEAKKMHDELDKKISKCPRCTSDIELVKERYPKGVSVDACPECSGIWLDGGEIHKLRDRTLVNISDKIYSIKSIFSNGLQQLIYSRRKPKPNQ
ncbi:MAG: zf-TFIIB domain-containing protein [Candidatus Omnitrophica bacterium]|nr:zf-TFIIB domain-containing protein [Candidatus Omnitrophota bacterium]